MLQASLKPGNLILLNSYCAFHEEPKPPPARLMGCPNDDSINDHEGVIAGLFLAA